MRTDLFDYTLPPELIAQTPLPRGQSRLLVLHKSDGRIEHRRFPDLLEYLDVGDTLVLNDTRVIARRIGGVMPTGGKAEIFLLRPQGERQWAALVRPGRSLKPGRQVVLQGPDVALSAVARVVETTPDGGRILEFETQAVRDLVGTWGVSPLPPYIHAALPADQEERYQTVYARHDGSAAAPTAGLHFTPELLQQAQAKGIALALITLHVGIDTFRPVRVLDTSAHEMHGEAIVISPNAAQTINRTPGRVIAAGTTSARALESAAQGLVPPTLPDKQPDAHETDIHRASERIAPYAGDTRLFITPGYRFRALDGLITNFHLPRSTLLMLISALAGRENILRAYEEAVQQQYRFYSFGDAMLII